MMPGRLEQHHFYETSLHLFVATWVCLKMLCSPLYPMEKMIIIPSLNGDFIGNIPYFQTNPQLTLMLTKKIALLSG